MRGGWRRLRALFVRRGKLLGVLGLSGAYRKVGHNGETYLAAIADVSAGKLPSSDCSVVSVE
jgi:hypothetical protein